MRRGIVLCRVQAVQAGLQTSESCWYLLRLCNLTTIQREWCALHAFPRLPFKDALLAAAAPAKLAKDSLVIPQVWLWLPVIQMPASSQAFYTLSHPSSQTGRYSHIADCFCGKLRTHLCFSPQVQLSNSWPANITCESVLCARRRCSRQWQQSTTTARWPQSQQGLTAHLSSSFR